MEAKGGFPGEVTSKDGLYLLPYFPEHFLEDLLNDFYIIVHV